MKAILKKHRKKSIVAASIIATLTTILICWNDVYPVVCLMVHDKARCMAIGKVTTSLADKLDENHGDIQLDKDGGQ